MQVQLQGVAFAHSMDGPTSGVGVSPWHYQRVSLLFKLPHAGLWGVVGTTGAGQAW